MFYGETRTEFLFKIFEIEIPELRRFVLCGISMWLECKPKCMQVLQLTKLLINIPQLHNIERQPPTSQAYLLNRQEVGLYILHPLHNIQEHTPTLVTTLHLIIEHLRVNGDPHHRQKAIGLHEISCVLEPRESAFGDVDVLPVDCGFGQGHGFEEWGFAGWVLLLLALPPFLSVCTALTKLFELLLL